MPQSLGIDLMFYIPILFSIFFVFFFYCKYDKEYKVSFKERYFKERASEDPPAAVSFLIDFNGIGMKDVYATIIDLMQSGCLLFEEGVFKVGGDCSGLLPHKLALLEKLTSPKTQDSDFITGWVFLAKEDAKAFNYYEERSFIKVAGTLAGVFYVLIGAAGVILSQKIRFFVLFAISAALFFYMRKIEKRTRAAQAGYEKWMALKRYLADLDSLDEEADPNILPFAYSFGIMPGNASKLTELCSQYKDALDRADVLLS